MFILFFIGLLVFTSVIIAEEECKKHECLAAGSNCTNTYTNMFEESLGKDESVCSVNTYCSPTSDKCTATHSSLAQALVVPRDFDTESCEHASDCKVMNVSIPNAACTKAKKCKLLYYPGDSCVNNDDCVAGDCVDGRCEGLKEKAECQHIGQCAWGTACLPTNETMTCQAWTDVAAECDENEANQCGAGAKCFEKQCVQYFSLGRDAACDEVGSSLCAEGLTCTRPNREKPLLLTCQSVAFERVKECKTDKDCVDYPIIGAHSTCACNEYEGKRQCVGAEHTALVIEGTCRDVTIDILQCALDNKCVAPAEVPLFTFYHDENACIWRNCPNDLLRMERCTCLLFEELVGSECVDTASLHCDIVWLPWFTVLVIAAALLVIGFIGSLVWCICTGKKRVAASNGYEPI